MANWIETKVTYDKLQENAATAKKTTESFLVDALSFAEAEERIIVERKPYIMGDFTVSAVKKTRISEILRGDDGGQYYIVRWQTEIPMPQPIPGKAPSAKKAAAYSLVEAQSLADALKMFEESMKGFAADVEILSVSLTPILDIYPYGPKQ